MSKVRSLRPGGKIDKSILVELASDPNLESFQIVCFWKGGATSIGWPAGMNNETLAYGAASLNEDTNRILFRGPHAPKD